jgi:N-acetyl sugar amidotransferase
LHDETVAGITFGFDGTCSHCREHDRLELEYPTGNAGVTKLQAIADRVRREGRNHEYDVVVGISGGCDSSCLLYLTTQLGLRPLAVHFDNGWNMPVAEGNIRRVTETLGVNLQRQTVDRAEYDDICRAFLLSGVPDIDIANDIGLTTVLYRAAEDHHVKTIFIGHSFRTEGFAPVGWTYMDGRYIASVHQEYGAVPMSTFPNLWLKDFVRRTSIKRFRPLYYMNYAKEEAKEFLSRECGWQWYGGHHLENQFTAFVSKWFLPRRYGIDKRLLEYSALIRSGQMTREEGLELISQPVECDPNLVEMVEARLGFSDSDLEALLRQPRKTHRDFRTYKRFFEHTRPFWWAMYKLNRVPKSFYVKYASR